MTCIHKHVHPHVSTYLHIYNPLTHTCSTQAYTHIYSLGEINFLEAQKDIGQSKVRNIVLFFSKLFMWVHTHTHTHANTHKRKHTHKHTNTSTQLLKPRTICYHLPLPCQRQGRKRKVGILAVSQEWKGQISVLSGQCNKYIVIFIPGESQSPFLP